MNLLMLRGKEPYDRNPKETYYRSMADCDDIWTHLAHEIAVQTNGHSTVLYWGGKRKINYDKYCDEIRVSNFTRDISYLDHNNINVIFARGGFMEYDTIVKQFPKAFKIYYGAGRRYLPRTFAQEYDIILVDSPEQLFNCAKYIHDLNLKCKASLLIKPAVDHMFPNDKIYNKQFDICYVANGPQENRKGQEFIFSTAPSDLKILHLGFQGTIKPPKHIASHRALRCEMPALYNKCKIGIIPYTQLIDSCPRVIPEMLSCGLPIVVLKDGIHINESIYVNEHTGLMTNRDNFWNDVRYVLQNYESYDTSSYYNKYLSLSPSAKNIIEIIQNAKQENSSF